MITSNFSLNSPWIFQKDDSSSLNNFKGELGTYNNGGYYLYFEENCSTTDLELKSKHWVDKYTRSKIV